MTDVTSHLIKSIPRLHDEVPSVIPWASPVSAFGDPNKADIATVGLNPSNIEFMDRSGGRLTGSLQRLETLFSLGLESWERAKARHVEKVNLSCRQYFNNRPYRSWFGSLEPILNSFNRSFYNPRLHACHFDIVPFSTSEKWGKLSVTDRNFLADASAAYTIEVLKQSNIKLLIVNGRGVADYLSRQLDLAFSYERCADIDITHANGNIVKGAYLSAELTIASGRRATRSIRILGFNHNIQSSFGVSQRIKENISRYLTKKGSDLLI